MYKTALEMPLRDFIAAHEIPDGDNIRVILPTCDDDGEILKAQVVYEGKAGDVSEDVGALMINAVNSDFWQNQSGYWHIERTSVYASDAA